MGAACAELGAEQADQLPENIKKFAQMQQKPLTEREFVYSIGTYMVERHNCTCSPLHDNGMETYSTLSVGTLLLSPFLTMCPNR